MDTLVYSLIRITLMILIFRTVLRLMNGRFSTRSFMKQEDQTHHTNSSDTQQSEENEKKPEPPKMVHDEVTKELIPEHKAYILVDDDGTRHYFSDWDSREIFINARKR